MSNYRFAIREIRIKDNEKIARVIHSALIEFGAQKKERRIMAKDLIACTKLTTKTIVLILLFVIIKLLLEVLEL